MVKQWLTTGSLWMMGGLLTASAGIAHADIKYVAETRMGTGDAAAKPMMVITTAIMKGAQRTETATSFGPMSMTTVELKLCDKQQSIKLNSALKIYTVTPFEQKPSTTATNTPEAAAGDNGGQRGTGKMIMTSSVKDLGEETIADVKTEHYLITMRMQSSGCAGNGDTSFKEEIWVGPDLTTELNCDVAQVDPAVMSHVRASNCKMSFEYHGDTDAYRKIMSGIIMRMKMYMGDTDKPSMVQEVSSLSRAKLEDSLFAVPADYKQVSEKEFQDAQSRAMMQAMMEQAKKGAGNNGAGGDNGAGNNQGGGDQGNGANNGNGGNDNNGGNKAEGDQGNKGNDGNNGDNGNNGQQEEPKKKKKRKLPFGLPKF
ncbi:MAG: hypothetical protein JO316_06760 [Abitibacteriaceae bacterium]|nr:hypothetical protein [Abditibacteriaceae bacterium]